MPQDVYYLCLSQKKSSDAFLELYFNSLPSCTKNNCKEWERHLGRENRGKDVVHPAPFNTVSTIYLEICLAWQTKYVRQGLGQTET